MTVTLSTPRVTLVMGDALDDSTWVEITVQALNIDLIAFEREAAIRKWPGPGSGGSFQWLTYLAWHALRRRGGDYAVPTFAEFAPLSVSAPDDDDDTDDDAEVPPTLPGLE